MQIGTLTTGAGVSTSLNSTKQIFQAIQVGAPETDLPIQRFVVDVAGRTIINIIGQAFVQAYSKIFGSVLVGATATLSNLLPVANGSKGNQQTTYTLENAGATTPAVYGFGTREYTAPFLALMDAIQDKSAGLYSGIDYLVFDPTNLDKATVTFPGGWTEDLSETELRGLATGQFNALGSDAGLATLVVLDMNDIGQIRLSANGGAIDVLRVKLPA